MRWTARRKAEVLEELRAAPEQSAEIMTRHGLSAEEATEWLRAEAEHGRAGLSVYGRRT